MTLIGAIHCQKIHHLVQKISGLSLPLPVERLHCRLVLRTELQTVIHRKQHTKSITPAQDVQTARQKKGLVYVSSSSDPFANLAFEDWVHDNWDLSHLNLLFLWRNEPSIVIGRHQNPWTECNIQKLMNSNVKLARRRSGGGTVYHDLGNVNCTFFTHRKSYDRKLNLQTMVDGMKKGWPELDIHISPRDDLMLNHFYKISGSSARLSRKIAYHHCTLLHSANSRILSSLLNVNAEGIKSNATESIKSPVINLRDAEPWMTQDDIIKLIAKEFYAKNQPYFDDQVYTISPENEKMWNGIAQKKMDLMFDMHGMKLASVDLFQNCTEQSATVTSETRRLLTQKFIRKDAQNSWEWIYGKTPKFRVEKQHGDLSAIVHVNKGMIEGVVLHMPFGWLDIFLVQQLTTFLKGKRYWITDVAMTIDAFLNEVDVHEDTREKLETLRHLIEQCIS